jgi:hypothetical protein
LSISCILEKLASSFAAVVPHDVPRLLLQDFQERMRRPSFQSIQRSYQRHYMSVWNHLDDLRGSFVGKLLFFNARCISDHVISSSDLPGDGTERGSCSRTCSSCNGSSEHDGIYSA